MKKYTEKGQATIELILMLLALTTCMLGVLFVGAITISNNQRLLASKFEAEKKSRSSNSSEIEKQQEVSFWRGSSYVQSYLKELFGVKGNFDLPFGLDYSNHRSSLNTLQNLSISVQTPSDSRLQNLYYWEETNSYNNRFSASLMTVTDNAFNAAQLVSHHSLYVENEKNISDFADKNASKAAKSWMGITVSDSDIRRNPSNKVFMPWIKPNKKLME